MLGEALSILIGAFLGSAAVMVVAARAMRSHHECGLTPIAVDHQSTGMFGPAKTVVLWRCPLCGTVETTTVDGRFTLAQVQGDKEEEIAS